VRDLVKDTSTNNIFICITAHTSSGSQPLTTNTDAAKWALIVDAASATTSQNAAAASATASANSATASASSASSSSTKADEAAASASTASTKAGEAASSATAAASSATSAASSLSTFQSQYHGAASSDPSSNLSTGDLYFNTSSNTLKVYNGSAWVAAAFDTSGALLAANNLSDVASAATARTNLGVIGKQCIWVPASAMQPTTSNGCSALTTVETTSGRPDMVVLDFDKDSDEFAQFSVAFPKQYNLGTVSFQAFWAGIASTGTVHWMVDAVAVSNDGTIDVAYGTAVVKEDNAQGAVEELNVSGESTAVTIAGSPADDDLCFFRVGRDVSGDNMAGDARLLGIKLFYTTDAANDA